MKKRELILIFFIITVCLILFLYNYINKEKGESVYVYVDSKLYQTLPLYEDKIFNINDTNTIEIKGGYVFMKNATCPDKLCIKQGKIHDTSREIICLPNKVVIKVNKKSDIDAVTN